MFEFDYSLKKRFGAWGAAGDIDIDREKLIGAEDDAILTFKGKRPAGDGAVAERHDPFGLRHLIVEGLDAWHHLFGDGAGDDHDIALSGGGTKDLRAEP